jgi:hypothetical protein
MELRSDLSSDMPTLADFTEEPPGAFVQDPDVQPDMVKHDPNTFAALTGQSALKTLYQQGLSPTGDDIKAIEAKALESANDYHKTLAQQEQAASLEIQKRQALVQTGTLASEETIKAAIAQAKEEAQKQFEQGPGAVATAKAQGGSGLIQRLPDADVSKLDGYAGAYDTVSNLHAYFKNGIQNTPGAGGVLRSLIGGFFTQPALTSPQYRAFKAYAEGSISPIARGVLGDVPVAATKENIMERLGTNVMPDIDNDNDASGGQKVFLLKQRIMQNLQDFRDDRANNGFDTTAIDRQIGKFNSDFMSKTTQHYNPLANSGIPLVQTGTSAQANATIASTNAGANAGITPMRPTGPGGTPSTMPTPAPSAQQTQPGPQPQTATQQSQDLWGFGTFNQ